MTNAYETPLTASDVSVGDQGPEVVVENVERSDFVKYAGASGDFNPIHYDESYATDAGNPSVFGQGMLTAGYAAHMVEDWFGIENITRFKVRLRSQLWPDDTVTVTGEVTDLESATDGATIHADVLVTNQDDDVLITGESEAILPP